MRQCLFVLLTIICLGWAEKNISCPQQCSCSAVNIRGGDSGVRVRCGHDPLLQDITVLDKKHFPPNTIHLDLSGNNLKAIRKGQLDFLPQLQKLVVANNRLSRLEDGALSSLVNLQHLDFSGNKLSSLSHHTWAGLVQLQRLKLAHNWISRLEEETFEPLSNLRTLDLSDNPLICDCELSWLERRSSQGIMSLRGRCALPPPLYGTHLKRLQTDSLHCNWPLQLPLFQLRPSGTQVVFAGDSLRLNCRVSSADSGLRVSWAWRRSADAPLDIDPASKLSHVQVDARTDLDDAVILASVNIKHLEVIHGGEWMCAVNTSRGNSSETVSLVVLTPDAPYCPRNSTSGGRGTYNWPEVVGGVQSRLPCKVQSSAQIGSPSFASRRCSPSGKWETPQLESCTFERENARLLHQMARADITRKVGPSLLAAAAKQLQNASGELHGWEEVALAARAALRLTNVLGGRGRLEEEGVGAAVTDLMERMMVQGEEGALEKAQREDQACHKLIRAAETVALALPSFRHHGPLLALEVLSTSSPPSAVSGGSGTSTISCIWVSLPPTRAPDRLLHCTADIPRGATPSLADNEQVEAWIRVPTSLLLHSSPASIAITDAPEDTTTVLPEEAASPGPSRIIFAAFANGRLFPGLPEGLMRVAPVVGCTFGGEEQVMDLKEPVVITLRIALLQKSNLEVGWWEKKEGWVRAGEGGWCKINGATGMKVQFQCWRLGYFTLLAPLSSPNNPKDHSSKELQPTLFLPVSGGLHPAVYIGSAVCIASLLGAVVIQLACWKKSGLSRCLRHTLLNGWLSIASLEVVFCVGTVPPKHQLPCGILGLVLHYLSLSSLLWMLLAVHCLKRKINKKRNGTAYGMATTVPEDEEDSGLGPKAGRIQRLIQLYLLGWGPGLLAVGVSGAVHLPEYSSGPFCFLRPALWPGAVCLPLSLLVLLTLLHLIMAHRAVRTVAISEGASTWSEEDISPSLRSSQSSLVPDSDQSPMWTLRALEVQLVLYLLGWLSGVASVCPSSAFMIYGWDPSVFFPVLFFFLSSALGTWVLLAFCLCRTDLWKALKDALCQNRAKERTAAEDGEETTPEEDTCRTLLPQMEDAPANDVEVTTVTQEQEDEPQNQPLVLSNGYLSCESVPESFYNAYQSGIARRFFERQRQRSDRHSEGEAVGGSPGSTGPRANGVRHITSDGASETGSEQQQQLPASGHLYRTARTANRRAHHHHYQHQQRPRRKGGGGRVVAEGEAGCGGDASPGWTNKETCV